MTELKIRRSWRPDNFLLACVPFLHAAMQGHIIFINQ
jgi:hypothetical protein